MNEKIMEEDELGDVGGSPLKGKGKEKESLRSDGHSRLGGVTAAVIEDLAQVSHSTYVWQIHRLRAVLCC